MMHPISKFAIIDFHSHVKIYFILFLFCITLKCTFNTKLIWCGHDTTFSYTALFEEILYTDEIKQTFFLTLIHISNEMKPDCIIVIQYNETLYSFQ